MLTALLRLEADEGSREIERQGGQELLRFGLILNYTSDTENPRATRRWVLPGTIGDQCKLRFLPRLEQLRRPRVDIVWEKGQGEGGQERGILSGTIPRPITRRRAVADLLEHTIIASITKTNKTPAAAARAFTDHLQKTTFAPPAFKVRTMIREEPLAESDRRATLETIAQETGRRRRRPSKGGARSDGPILESDFLETEASAHNPAMGMIVGPLNGVVSGAIGSIVPVAVGPLASAIAPAVAPGATEISSEVADLLKPALTLQLSTSLPDVLMEALPDSITEAVSEAAAHVMTDGLTETLGNSLSRFLVDGLSQHVALEATDLMSHKISQRLTKSLTATLGRSVSHALVPALVHTVSHNPLMDYYCYYCFYKKMYCSYCQYAPSQLYYTMCTCAFLSSSPSSLLLGWLSHFVFFPFPPPSPDNPPPPPLSPSPLPTPPPPRLPLPHF